jgi:hypothetical protein
MIEGVLDTMNPAPNQKKSTETPVLVALVNNNEFLNNFALVFIAKKSKKIDLIVPLLVEFS